MNRTKNSVVVRIAGAAGDGIASTGEIFGLVCARQGLHVMAYNSYQSAIRGGHVWLQLNVGSEQTMSHGTRPDILLLLNKTSPVVHIPQMRSGGVVFYNASLITDPIPEMRDDLVYYRLPFKELMNDTGVKPVMANIMLLGCLIESLGLDAQTCMDIIADRFQKAGEVIFQLNQRIYQIGTAWAKENVKPRKVPLKGDGKKRMFLNGNSAFGMGFIAHGLKFYAAYPMSPATGILHYLAKKAKSHKIIVKQTEDEIAAVNFIIGAAHAGVRAAAATSGGGFSLMTEGVGLAGMLEEPIVIIDVQRGGPSTGIPTKQEQGDLNQMLGASQGEFARIILAPKDTADAFETAGRAMNLAEKYQTPVLILSDLFLSEHFETQETFDDVLPIERGKLLFDADENYKRFLITADGVSQRLVPGVPKAMYVSPSDEHDEKGIVISDVLAGLPESLDIRKKMHAKRMKKLETARVQDMRLPILTEPKDADLTLLGWGSTYHAIEEACIYLTAAGLKVNHIHFTDIFPLPQEEVLGMLESCRDIVAVEGNYTSQMARLIRAETGFEIKQTVNRFDGEPFTGEEIFHDVMALKGIEKKELSHV